MVTTTSSLHFCILSQYGTVDADVLQLCALPAADAACGDANAAAAAATVTADA